MPDETVKPSLGYFGKVPERGDFIQDQISPDFVKPWNEWLQATLAVSREQLGEEWLDYYLTSPVWHFSLSAGVCGDSGMVGTFMPSIDQVGRHFYFTVAAEVDRPAVCYWLRQQWSQNTEDHVLKLLDEPIDLKQWISTLNTADWFLEEKPERPVIMIDTSNSEQLVLLGGQDFHSDHLQHKAFREKFDRYCIWWTSGSEQIPECTLVTKGLPLVSQFSAMLDGNWEQWGW